MYNLPQNGYSQSPSSSSFFRDNKQVLLMKNYDPSVKLTPTFTPTIKITSPAEELKTFYFYEDEQDILEKLPGIKVNDGTVYRYGKKLYYKDDYESVKADCAEYKAQEPDRLSKEIEEAMEWGGANNLQSRE